MLSENQLFEQFSNTCLHRVGQLYLTAAQCVEYTEECRKNNLSVARLEGFINDNGELTTDLSVIGVFSPKHETQWNHFMELCNNNAVEFVTKLRDRAELVFNPVVLSEQELRS